MTRVFFFMVVTCAVTGAWAASLSRERLNALPAPERAACLDYFERSQTNAQRDAAVLQAEVQSNKMTNALRAPSGGDFKLPAKEGAAWYSQAAAGQLADVILSYQTPAGGWSKHTG